MLVFLRDKDETNDVIATPIATVVVDYRKLYPKLRDDRVVVIPWYQLQPDPAAFAEWLLAVACRDKVCVALAARASDQWGLDFSFTDRRFVQDRVQEHYLKQLRNWLNPLSGNMGRRTAHTGDLQRMYDEVWKACGLNQGDVLRIGQLPFFSLDVSGRRDRAQIYRNITEAARALIGEVTSWPSRQVEKLAAYSLLASPGLARLQRQMLAAVATTKVALSFPSWEYLPYYLRGNALERVKDDVAMPRVLGALHDCLLDDPETSGLANDDLVGRFRALEGGKEYRRWRLLPAVVRYQVMLSDLCRMFEWGKIESAHQRVEFPVNALAGLPTLQGFSGWPLKMVEHGVANPHDPGRKFPFAAGWARNEFCPNVITSRLLLAPLYAGTSGHTQGRILGWRELENRCGLKALAKIPVGVVIACGYSVLWRLYYDKRATGFHTMFEALQGTHADPRPCPRGGEFERDDVVWGALLASSETGCTNVPGFWTWCLRHFGSRGSNFALQHKGALGNARSEAAKRLPGTVIPHWSDTHDDTRTAPDVEIWTEESNEVALKKIYDEWTLIALNTPLPDGFDDDF